MGSATVCRESVHALRRWGPPANPFRARNRVEESELLPEFSGAFTRLRIARLLVIGADLGVTVEQLGRDISVFTSRVQIAGTGPLSLDLFRAALPDVVLLDMSLADQSALEVHQQIRSIDARIPVIFVMQSTRPDALIAAMKQGAYDCLQQPLDQKTLQRVICEALDVSRRMRQSATFEEPASPTEPESEIIGCCPAMGEVYKAVGRVADQEFPVLITGESGTGKELVARAIHQHGPRSQAPFLALNCAAIPENLLESELFGHEKGAFTGADRRRIGKFEQCSDGTIFLDEIGDMPLALQAKILRLIQQQEFERVGGNETIRTKARLIAATHRDLKAWSLEGKFRPDLYYRLGVFTIPLPPLRERGEDQSLLVRHYLRRFSPELKREVREIAPEALELLRSYSWPGNIRELQSVLKQALLRASGPVLLPCFLPHLSESSAGAAANLSGETEPAVAGFSLPRDLSDDVRDLYAETHRQADRLLLPRVLEHTKGNLQRAALLLGIARQTLRLKLREIGLSVTRAVEATAEQGVC